MINKTVFILFYKFFHLFPIQYLPGFIFQQAAAMKNIFQYLKDYAKITDGRIFVCSLFFVALAIFVNYHYHLNRFISHLDNPLQYLAWYGVFLLAFSFTYALYPVFGKAHHYPPRFFLLLLIAPAIFSWKMVYDIDISFPVAPPENNYWNAVIYWPFKLLVIASTLWLIWKLSREDQPFYGWTTAHFKAGPYLLMLLIMVPLIAAASTQPDFLSMYPKMNSVPFLRVVEPSGPYKLLYELSYGSDFFSIELFFRGFLVLAFVRWFGRDAILPMACFYCTIHFGKPLGECISSFFGGLLLGIVTYHTRTIFGGLMVHLGIAWMMELGGYIGNSL